MKRFPIYFLIFLLLIQISFSEESSAQVDESISPESGLLPLLSDRNMLLLSMSAEDYPVTPGDIYKLSYLTANAPVSHEVIVESDFTINLNVFGKTKAENISFTDFKKIVEYRVTQAYPDSTPSITILSNGRFQVYMKGEVQKADYITAWGLTRLSQVIDGRLTPYSSIRDMEITSREGAGRKYDLFMAQRFGEKEQDPYIKPGDTIVVSKREREVEITGEVRRPEKYQLLPAEGLKDLIEFYGDGFTVLANKSRIILERLVTESDKIAESFTLDLSLGYDQELELKDLDTIFVPQKTARLPVVYLEGAISSDIESKEGEEAQPESSNKVTVTFKEGDTAYNILWPRRNLIYPAADLPNSFISRDGNGKVIPVNLEKLLYDYDPSQDIELMPYDHIIIPFRQFFVMVTGGVHDPGRYPYVPEKTSQYYINLAGGIDPERGSDSVVITDRNNNKRDKQSILEPEDRVFVPYSFSYHFLKYTPLVISSITAVLSILIAAGVF